MPAKETTPSRRIVLRGLGAGAPTPEMAISLVDKAGDTLSRISVHQDGSCELSEEALALADGVLIEPYAVSIDADRFRRLIETDTLDVEALLPAAAPCFVPRPPRPPRDPGRGGW
jgi:hypothetical protein